MERKARKPKVTYPPVWAIFFPGLCFREGIEAYHIMEQEVRIYNAPKTVVPTKVLIFRFCLRALKKSSICQRSL